MSFVRLRQILFGGRRDYFPATASYLFAGLLACVICGCDSSRPEGGRYPVSYDTDCLPNVTLIDQHDHPISLATLKGRPVLFDFIYTSCPGPCEVLTQHMALIAKQLGPALGTKVWFVSVSIDPQHDNPRRLLSYAQALGANLRGWYFLTGSTPQVEDLLARFKLRIQHESDGSIDHVLEYFLVNPDGRPSIQYVQEIDPSAVARDVRAAAPGKGVIGSAGSDPGARG